MEQEISGSNTPSKMKQVFYNDHGLRAGWRLLIYLAMIRVLVLSGKLITQHLGPPSDVQPPPLVQTIVQFAGEIVLFLILLFLAWIMSRIERRPVGVYGLPLQRTAVSHCLKGYFFWGLLPLVIALVLLRVLHAFYFGQISPLNGQIFGWGVLWLFFFLFVGFFEEYLFRGYFLYTLADGIGFWPAAIIQAILFGALHLGNGGETRIGIIAASLFAIFAAATVWRTGNLWLAVSAHAGWDWGQSYFFGVNDSGFQAPGHLFNPTIGQGPDWLTGGSVGPEGSVVTLILWVLLAVLFIRLYQKRNEPVLVITKVP